MFEAANHRMWDITSGVMIWKLNAVWPQVLWQIYDWFLNPNAAYYYTKKALEPLHIQLNELDYTVSVINTRHKSHKNLTAIVKVFNLDMTEQWHKEQKFTIEADRYKELFKIPELQGLNLAYFVRLQLKNNKGDVVSDNLYWLSSNKEQVDLRAIAGLSKTELDISHVIKSDGEEYMVIARIKNNSNKVSFFNRFMITKGEGGDEVWPTFWSDNFVTLFPGEEKVLTARFAKQDLDGKEAMMVLDKDF
jgi:exo-1,4-beta-D-glucosaminidase